MPYVHCALNWSSLGVTHLLELHELVEQQTKCRKKTLIHDSVAVSGEFRIERVAQPASLLVAAVHLLSPSKQMDNSGFEITICRCLNKASAVR